MSEMLMALAAAAALSGLMPKVPPAFQERDAAPLDDRCPCGCDDELVVADVGAGRALFEEIVR